MKYFTSFPCLGTRLTPEGVTGAGGVLQEKVFLEISKNSQEHIYARESIVFL